jgi:hypothetical protein
MGLGPLALRCGDRAWAGSRQPQSITVNESVLLFKILSGLLLMMSITYLCHYVFAGCLPSQRTQGTQLVLNKYLIIE